MEPVQRPQQDGALGLVLLQGQSFLHDPEVPIDEQVGQLYKVVEEEKDVMKLIRSRNEKEERHKSIKIKKPAVQKC